MKAFSLSFAMMILATVAQAGFVDGGIKDGLLYSTFTGDAGQLDTGDVTLPGANQTAQAFLTGGATDDQYYRSSARMSRSQNGTSGWTSQITVTAGWRGETVTELDPVTAAVAQGAVLHKFRITDAPMTLSVDFPTPTNPATGPGGITQEGDASYDQQFAQGYVFREDPLDPDFQQLVAFFFPGSTSNLELTPGDYVIGHVLYSSYESSGDFYRSTDSRMDWSVAPVPEPASMAVLGLGLAALKRRRRSS